MGTKFKSEVVPCLASLVPVVTHVTCLQQVPLPCFMESSGAYAFTMCCTTSSADARLLCCTTSSTFAACSLKELLPMARQLDPEDKVSTASLILGMAVMAGSLIAIAYTEPEHIP